jgi:hypothetical protein
MSAPSLVVVRNSNLKSVGSLAKQWRVPESVIVRECKDLLLLPIEAAEARMREEVPVQAQPRQRKAVSRG